MPGLKLVMDCLDPPAPAEFWAVALGYDVLGSVENYTLLGDASGTRPHLLLQKVPEGKDGKNRMHLDIVAVDIDAEGNEFCVCDGGAGS